MAASGARDFFGCYLLESHHPKVRGRSYIGFTVNPRRRIRQHNGEIVNGANKTKAYRPWEMVLVVYGFPTQVQALQFEWSWQHPEKSLDIRGVAARLGKKARYGVRGKVLLLMEMLRTEPWCYYPLTLQFLSSRVSAERGRCPPPPAHMPVLVAPLEALPEVVEDRMDAAEEEEEAEESEEDGEEAGGGANSGSDADGEQDALPSQQLAGSGGGWDDVGDLRQRLAARGGNVAGASSKPAAGGGEAAAARVQAAAVPLGLDPEAGGEPAGAAAAGGAKRGKGKAAAAKSAAAAARAASACALCSKAANRTWFTCGGCGSRCHVECLARHLLQADGQGASLPTRGQCPSCSKPLVWMEVLSSLENAGWEKHKKQGGKGGHGSKAAAAAASQLEGSSLPSSPSGAVAAAGRGKGKGGRGKKAASADAADAASGVAEGEAAAAPRVSKARGKKGTAVAAAAGVPNAEEDGTANLAGSAAAAGGEPTKHRGRPRKTALPAFPPGGLFAGDSLQGGSPAAPQQGQQRRRRRQQPGPAAQAQPARQVWAAAAAEPLEVLEAAAPWDDFDLTGSEPAGAYMPPGAQVPAGAPPSFSPGQPALVGTSWGGAGVVAPAETHMAGREDFQGAAGGSLQRAAGPAEVVVLSDSDSEGGLGSPLLPLAQRLQHQRRQQCAGGGQREDSTAHATRGEGRGSQLWESWGQPAEQQRQQEQQQQLQEQQWLPAERIPSSSSPPGGAGAAVGPGRWDSPPTHRLGTFQLASLPASPASHHAQPPQQQEQHQQQHQQQQQELYQHGRDLFHDATASSPSQLSPMSLDSSLPALGAAPGPAAPAASPSRVAPAAQRSLAWEPAAPMDAAGPRPGSMQHLGKPAPLPGGAGVAAAQRRPLLGSGSGAEVVDLVGQEGEAGPSPALGFRQQRHRSQQQQQQQQQQHGPVEVVELISPSPLPLRERLRQGPQLPGGWALAGSAEGASLGAEASLGARAARAAGHSAKPSQGQQLAGGGSDGALRGEELPQGEEMAAARPRRIRAYSRGRRLEPKPAADTAALGPSRPAAKTRSLASPRGTPSPAPLRKRVQQQQQGEEGGGAGFVTAGAGWAHALEDCGACLQGSFDANQAQQQQQQHDAVAQGLGFTTGGKVPADSEDDVIVISD